MTVSAAVNAMSFGDALARGLERSKMSTEHRANQELVLRPLKDYMALQGVVTWSDVTIEMVKGYVAHLEAEGKRANTIRAYLNPIRIAYREARVKLDDRLLCLRGVVPDRPDQPKRFLSLPQLMAAIACAREAGDRAALLGFVCGGLAGMRITEIMRLTSDKVDWDAGTVETGHKNEASLRVIPVCDMVLETLRDHFDYRDKPYAATSTFSHHMRWILNTVAEETGDKSFTMVTPKDAGRKSFVNCAMYLCQENGYDTNLVRAYIGHAFPQWDILHRNYASLVPRPNDMPIVQQAAVTKLRKLVIEPLENEIKKHL